MSEGDDATIVLRMKRGAPVPAGELCGVQGPPEPFDGWLQLLGALERRLEILADAAAIDRSD